MMPEKQKYAVFITAFAVVFGCSATRVTSEWKDESYLKKPGRILVLAQTGDTAQRRIMEDEMVSRLKEAGTDAVAGYTVLPESRPLDWETVAAGVKELGADAVFVTRLLDRKADPQYVPGTEDPRYDFYGGFYSPHAPGFPPGGYPSGYPRVEFPGHTAVNVYDVAEANLFDAATGKVVWSAASESRVNGGGRRAIRSYASKIMKSLRKQNLVG